MELLVKNHQFYISPVFSDPTGGRGDLVGILLRCSIDTREASVTGLPCGEETTTT